MLVSVIIPCYNVEEYIEECVRSVLNQTYRDIEIICVDDGSTDNTLSVLKKFGKEVTIISTDHKGANHARNKGMEIAKGEYLQFLDADDYLLPGKLSSNIELITQNDSDECLLIGNFYKKELKKKDLECYNYYTDQWLALITYHFGTTSSNLWHKKLIEQAGHWDESLSSCQDYDLLFRIIQSGAPIIFDAHYLAVKRVRRNSINNATSDLQHNEARMQNAVNFQLRLLAYLARQQQLTPQYGDASYQEIFLHIKRFSRFDLEKALFYKQQYLPPDYFPGLLGLSRFYLLNYRLWGYKTAEIIANFINILRGRN
jgi:glycosyltransferase involved in cell wall biosynthesis